MTKLFRRNLDYNCPRNTSLASFKVVVMEGLFSLLRLIVKLSQMQSPKKCAWLTLKPKLMMNYWRLFWWRNSRRLMRGASKSLPTLAITPKISLRISTFNKLDWKMFCAWSNTKIHRQTKLLVRLNFSIKSIALLQSKSLIQFSITGFWEFGS